jgi:hypothetical protein
MLSCALFSGASATKGEKWEKPVWKAGDKLLDVRGQVDVGQILGSSGYGSYGSGASGTVAYHAFLTVDSKDAMKAGVPNYKIDVDFGIDADVSMETSQNLQGYSYKIAFDFDILLDVTGSIYLTVDKIALTELDLAMGMDYALKMDITTNNPDLKDLAGSMSIDGNMNMTSTALANPPLDIFDFPVVVGEHWNTSASELHVVNTATGTSTITNTNGSKDTIDYSGPEFNYERNESATEIPLWAPDNVENPKTITIDGKSYNVFIIELDIDALNFGIGKQSETPKGATPAPMASTPSLPVSAGKADLYYSTDDNKFVGFGVKDGYGNTLFDTTQIAPPKTATNWVIVAAVAGLIMAVIIVVAVVLIVKKGKKNQAMYFPVTPPAPQYATAATSPYSTTTTPASTVPAQTSTPSVPDQVPPQILPPTPPPQTTQAPPPPSQTSPPP